MPNPIMEQINSGSQIPATNNLTKPQIQQAKQALQQLMSLRNPQAMMNQMLMNNPNIKPALELIKQNGGNLQTAFMSLAKQKGINPTEFIQELMSQ